MPVAVSKPKKCAMTIATPQSPCQTSLAATPPWRACRTPRRRHRLSRGGGQPHHNTIPALARPPTAQLLWANAGYSDKVTGNDEPSDGLRLHHDWADASS
jgi:hypothetical protein